jgi:DNA-binding transcriptional LysR family regulator
MIELKLSKRDAVAIVQDSSVHANLFCKAAMRPAFVHRESYHCFRTVGLHMRKVIELNDIHIFVAVSDAGTLRRAAEILQVPTSTVSRSLSRLEKSLDLLLVRRTQRGIVLTDAGKQYLHSCRHAMRTLREGVELLDNQRKRPSGIIRVGCPITVARSLIAPILGKFTSAYPDLRIQLESYSSGWDQDPKDDIDIFFKILAPRDSSRKVRCFPASLRGLFATRNYLESAGTPRHPAKLISHRCIGWDVWKFSRGDEVIVPDIKFQVTTSDPGVALQLALDGVGISILPLWMAYDPAVHQRLVAILPTWKLPPITFCALYSETLKLTPKIKVFFEFVEAYIGTERDPRLHGAKVNDCFAPSNRNDADRRTKSSAGIVGRVP